MNDISLLGGGATDRPSQGDRPPRLGLTMRRPLPQMLLADKEAAT